MLSEAIDHRFNKGYRNMRFLRYVFKQKAVNEICNMIAPPTSSLWWASETGTVQAGHVSSAVTVDLFGHQA
jgi:hypothetical protein